MKLFTAVPPSRFTVILGFILLGCGLSLAAEDPTFPGIDRKWRYLQSPNFELYSAHGDSASRDVLEQMELLRALFLDTFKMKVRAPQPVTIYYFDRQKDFDGYRPPSLRGDVTFKGVFSSHADRAVITLAPTGDDKAARELVYHEYVHYLFRIAERNPAPWFNEGVAELFSTMQETKDSLVLGNPVAGRVYELRNSKMMPFDELFAVRHDSPVFQDSRHAGIFYAQSWIFLHYCYFGVNKVEKDKMHLFLRVAESSRIQEHPGEFRAVCKELLGLDYPDMLKEMRRYSATGRFQGRKLPRPAIAPRQDYLSRMAGREEVTAQLAGLLLRRIESVYTRSFVEDVLAREPENILLHEMLGASAANARNFDAAREHWGRAVELGTANPAIFREFGRLECNAVFSKFDLDLRLPSDRAGTLRRLLGSSIEAAREQSQGYELLAWVEATAEKPDIANVNLIQQRFDTLNDKARTLLALAILRMHRGEKQNSLNMLDQLPMLDPSHWVLYIAELTRARLEERPVDPARLPKTDRFKIDPRHLELPE